jgi:uncharacterized membrane protein
VGVAFIAHPPLLFGSGSGFDTQRLLGISAGLASATFAAGAFLSIKSLGNSERAIVMSMWFHCVSAVACIVPLCMSVPSAPRVPTARECLLLGGIVVTSFLGQLLISRGFQLLKPSTAAAINLTQVLHADLLSTLALHEPVYWYSFAGAALIVAGVLLAQRSNAPADVEVGQAGSELAGRLHKDERAGLLHGAHSPCCKGRACHEGDVPPGTVPSADLDGEKAHMNAQLDLPNRGVLGGAPPPLRVLFLC